ncbi:MAG: IS3 family transposase [Desulfomonilaceae bacterium]
MPIVRQCRILQIARSGVYRKPVQDTDRNQDLIRLIKEIHSKHPDLGSRRMCGALQDRGYHIGRCAVRTLMRKMGIKTVYRKPSLSKSHPDHKKYPYLLRGLEIKQPNQQLCWLSIDLLRFEKIIFVPQRTISDHAVYNG